MRRAPFVDEADLAAATLFAPLALSPGERPLTTADWRRLGCRLPGRTGPAPAWAADRMDSRRDAVTVELEALARRGIRVLTVAHGRYPTRLLERLGERAPAALFVAGDPSLLLAEGVAIVGSRDVHAAGADAAAALGRVAAADHLAVFSGGARGVDRAAMAAALKAGGAAIGVLAGALDRSLQAGDTRRVVEAGQLTLVCTYHPCAPFTVAGALARNRLIYGLAASAIVVTSSPVGGGTRRGALEALRNGSAPVYALDGLEGGAGNRDLIGRGARPLPLDALMREQSLRRILESLTTAGRGALL